MFQNNSSASIGGVTCTLEPTGLPRSIDLLAAYTMTTFANTIAVTLASPGEVYLNCGGSTGNEIAIGPTLTAIQVETLARF
jgi:hypothetical protein